VGACREGLSIRRNPRALLRWRTWRYNWRLVVKDNLAWIVCAMTGHGPYNTSTVYEPPEYACDYCGSWLPELNPTVWRCSQHNVVYRVAKGCPGCRAAHVPLALNPQFNTPPKDRP